MSSIVVYLHVYPFEGRVGGTRHRRGSDGEGYSIDDHRGPNGLHRKSPQPFTVVLLVFGQEVSSTGESGQKRIESESEKLYTKRDHPFPFFL